MKIATLQFVLSALYLPCILAEKEDDHGSHLHCCIVNLVPPVRAVLPLCREILFLWSGNPNTAQKATVGAIWGNCEFCPCGGGISQTLVWGKQSVWLSACRTPSP